MISVLYCGNQAFFDGVLTSMLSILMRTESREPFCFYLYTMNLTRAGAGYLPITEKQAAFLGEVAKRYHPENRVVRIDVTDLYEKEFAYCPNESAYCSPYTLLRLLADEIEGMPDKLLYLDGDILFQRDIRLLYHIDIEGYEYAAARDHYGKFLVHPNFINAGVLLLNLPEIRKTGLFEKCRVLLRQKKLTFADESAVSHCTRRKKMLPQRFNDQKFLHRHTVVRHFSKRMFWLPYPHTANIKQWQVEKMRRVFHYSVFDDILNEYQLLKKKYENEK